MSRYKLLKFTSSLIIIGGAIYIIYDMFLDGSPTVLFYCGEGIVTFLIGLILSASIDIERMLLRDEKM